MGLLKFIRSTPGRFGLISMVAAVPILYYNFFPINNYNNHDYYNPTSYLPFIVLTGIAAIVADCIHSFTLSEEEKEYNNEGLLKTLDDQESSNT